MNYQIALILVLTLCISSCSKENLEPTSSFNPIALANNPLLPLTIGNYWVYEYSTHLPDGTVNPTIGIDTLKIIGDTLIDNERYAILKTDRPFKGATLFYRDSSGYILSVGGSIVLPPSFGKKTYNEHYGYISGDTAYYYFDVFPAIQSIQTNAGLYNCLLQVSIHEVSQRFGGAILSDSSYYSPIGPVQRSFAYLSGAKMVGTLIDYRLK